MSDETATLNVKGLDQLVKALKAKPPTCRVGILGSKASRSPSPGEKSTPTNAEVGAAHEFGTSTIPQRSFLRVPIAEGLQKEMESSGLLDKDALNDVIKSGSVTPWLKKVAISAEACVSDAFDSGGNGKWPPWKNSNYTNNSGQLLVDTKQLRESVTSEVKE